jgi:phage terminase large subunit-like protein
VDGRGYVLADRTCRLSPQGWGRRAIEAYDDFAADRIVAEKNYGGEMVRFTLQAVRKTAPVVLVNASRGKMVRAEPVSALYEQGRISHVIVDPANNPLSELEAEMRQATTGGFVGEGSPNRLDALVWALTDLFLAETAAGAAFLELARRDLAEDVSAPLEPSATVAAPGSLEWLLANGEGR